MVTKTAFMRPCRTSSLRTSSRNVSKPDPTPSSKDRHACRPRPLPASPIRAGGHGDAGFKHVSENIWSIRSLVHDLYLPERQILKAAIEVRRATRGLVQAHDDRGS